MSKGVWSRIAKAIGNTSATIKGKPVNRNALPRSVFRILFSKRSEEAIKGLHSSTVSFPIIRAGITIEWRMKEHQSEGIVRVLRPAGTHSIHRISLMSSLSIPSCWPRLLAISRSLGSSGLVERDLRNRLKPESPRFPPAEL